MDVSALPIDPGPAAWNDILPASRGYPQLQSDRSAEVVIVGAGFAGLAAAQRLADQGVRGIVLLEAKRLAEGPAGRNSGFMLDLPHELNSDSYTSDAGSSHQEIRLNRLAIAYAAELAERYGLSRETFNPCGRMTAAATDKGIQHLDSYLRELQALGEPVERLDASDLQRITGSAFYRQGIATQGAAMIQPAAFVRGWARGMSNQVDIFESSPVVEMNRQGADWSVRTAKGTVTTPQVILAVNGHIQSFGHYPKRLLHVFTYASMTRALSDQEMARLGGHFHWGILPADPMGTTVRRHGDRLIIRNHASLNQSLIASESDMARAALLQDRSYLNRFPQLAEVNFEYRWGGRLCLSLNSGHAFGELETGLISACCQNGLGTVKGMLSGMLAADLLHQGADEPNVAQFLALNSLKKLPPEPFLTAGATLTMRYKEWRAGIEL